jgi:hypothetical protein
VIIAVHCTMKIDTTLFMKVTTLIVNREVRTHNVSLLIPARSWEGRRLT